MAGGSRRCLRPKRSTTRATGDGLPRPDVMHHVRHTHKLQETKSDKWVLSEFAFVPKGCVRKKYRYIKLNVV